MTRTNAREVSMHMIFQLNICGETAEDFLAHALSRDVFASFAEEAPIYGDFPEGNQLAYITELVKGVYEHFPELDGYIAKYAVGWSVSRISGVALAIVRVAMYESLYMQAIPPAVAINEAVELAKHYEPDETVSFINGLLGAFARSELSSERVGDSLPSGPRTEETD
ncbi:MAG: transcription antitermination factor NusB [Oscillospiraceae bacterium]|nr:transcription antitermination factor NusB [Oscillospiraceae bacterium]